MVAKADLMIARALEEIAYYHSCNPAKWERVARQSSNGWNDLEACARAVTFARNSGEVRLEDVEKGYALITSGRMPVGYVGFLIAKFGGAPLR